MTGAQVQDYQMTGRPPILDDPPSPEERLKIHARVMSELAELSSQEIEAAMTTLHQMVDELKKRDELLEKLLDPATSYAEARQIVGAWFTSPRPSVSAV